MRILGIQDIDLIESVMLSDDVLDDIHDDGLNQIEDKNKFLKEALRKAVESERFIFLSPGEGVVFMLENFTFGSYFVHFGFLKENRGEKARIYFEKFLQMCFNELNFNKIMSYLPSYNHKVLKFFKRSGLNIEGVLKDAFLKDNQTYDLVIFGISKKEYKTWLGSSQ